MGRDYLGEIHGTVAEVTKVFLIFFFLWHLHCRHFLFGRG
jgi:hypothetical protein